MKRKILCCRLIEAIPLPLKHTGNPKLSIFFLGGGGYIKTTKQVPLVKWEFLHSVTGINEWIKYHYDLRSMLKLQMSNLPPQMYTLFMKPI